MKAQPDALKDAPTGGGVLFTTLSLYNNVTRNHQDVRQAGRPEVVGDLGWLLAVVAEDHAGEERTVRPRRVDGAPRKCGRTTLAPPASGAAGACESRSHQRSYKSLEPRNGR